MRKKGLCLWILFVAACLLTGCGESLLHEFRDDPAGQIAERFFPDPQALPDPVESVFEYREDVLYKGYYLKLVFDSDAAFERFLEQTETDYPDMTEEQRRNAYYNIDNVHFSVDDYSFRAIDMSGFGVLEDYIGLIAHCASERTVVFLYFYHDLGGIEDISDGLGRHGYMEFYGDSWRIEAGREFSEVPKG